MLKPLSPEAIAFLEEASTESLTQLVEEIVTESPMVSENLMSLCFDSRFKGSDSQNLFDGITQVLRKRVVGDYEEKPTRSISEWVDEIADLMDEPIYLMEPRSDYDPAIVGLIEGKAVYDTEKVLEVLKSQGMSQEEAWDYFEFNQQSEKWHFMGAPECFM